MQCGVPLCHDVLTRHTVELISIVSLMNKIIFQESPKQFSNNLDTLQCALLALVHSPMQVGKRTDMYVHMSCFNMQVIIFCRVGE